MITPRTCNSRPANLQDRQPGHTANPGLTAPLPCEVFAPLAKVRHDANGTCQLTDKSNKFDGWTRAVANHILFALIRTHRHPRPSPARWTPLDVEGAACRPEPAQSAIGALDCNLEDRVTQVELRAISPCQSSRYSGPPMDNPFFDAPILNSPYAYPARHWELDATGQPTQVIKPSRRSADFITPIPKPRKQKERNQRWTPIGCPG